MSILEAPQGSMLLQLPLELRLAIFDVIFQLLIELPKSLDTYALPYEFPKNDLSPYLNAVLVCKQLHEEVTGHFKKHYAPRITLRFDSVPPLHALCQKLSKPEPTCQDIHFSLRSRCLFVLDPKPSVDDPIEFDTFTFMDQQPGFDPLWTVLQRGFCSGHWELSHRKHSVGNNDDGLALTHSTRNGRDIDVLTIPIKERGGKMDIKVRQICGCIHSAYSEMRGSVGDIDWANFDIDEATKRLETRLSRNASMSRPYYRAGVAKLRVLLGLEVEDRGQTT